MIETDPNKRGLFKLPPEKRAKALAGMGMTEEEYRKKVLQEIERDQRHAELEAAGETVHGWSTKEENPGWSDDTPVGEVKAS